jgi:hypothetical protein
MAAPHPNDGPIQSVLSALTSTGCNPRKTQSGWEAHCPAHDDKHRSLSVGEGRDGRVLIKCHAGDGCSIETICAALGLETRDLFADTERRKTVGPGKIIAAYDYTDRSGQLLFQVVRTELRNFWQRRPDGNGGWINNLDGVERVLYRLPQVWEAAITGQSVIVVEGEKDADRLAAAGWCATTNPQGAGKWSSSYSKELKGLNVAVIADNDDTGRAHAQQVAAMLHGTAKTVRVVELAGLPEHGDVSDWFANGGSVDDLKDVINKTEPWTPRGDVGFTANEQSEFNALLDRVKDLDEDIFKDFFKELTKLAGKTNRATELVNLVTEAGIELWHNADMVGYATILVGDHQEHWPIRSRAFKIWLARRYYEKYDTAVSSQPMQDALGVLDGTALFAGPEYKTYVRVAEAAGTIYIDLANPLWEYAEIDADGWRVVPSVPVRFRRRKGMEPLPHPTKGGSLNELRPFVNATDDDWTLVVAWLVGAAHPYGPYAVLNITGEHGTAKSTIVRVLRRALDPNEAETPGPPTDSRDLAIAAENRWIVGYDNLSSLRPGLSDDFARLATGSGFGTRMLYENDEEMIFKACRPVVLDSIEDVVVRPDLLDRSLIVRPPFIPEENRKPEKKFWTEFEEARPRIVGALFDAVSCAVRRHDEVVLESLPRMADFTHWVVAAEPKLGIDEGSFLRAYRDNRAQGQNLAIESDAAFAAIFEFVKTEKHWTGSAAQLAGALVERCFPDGKRPPKGWPTDGYKMAGCLQRAAPVLRAHGVTVTHNPSGRPRTWTLSVEAHPSPNTRTRSNTGDEGNEVTEAPSDQGEQPDTFDATSTDEGDDATSPGAGDEAGDGPDTPPDQHFDTFDTFDTSFPTSSRPDDPDQILADKLGAEPVEDRFVDDWGNPVDPLEWIEHPEAQQLTIDGNVAPAAVPPHPAEFSDEIIPVLAAAVPPDRYPRALDCFAGKGGIHKLPNATVGVELELKWARARPGTINGNAFTLPFPNDCFDAVVTSPVYGNRMSDHHNARDGSHRRSYTHYLGEPLHPDNTGQLYFRNGPGGDEYRARHRRAWAEAVRVLRSGGRFVLNVKDWREQGELHRVTEFHVETLTELGLVEINRVDVKTRSFGYGANREAREIERVVTFDNPAATPVGDGLDDLRSLLSDDPKRFTR